MWAFFIAKSLVLQLVKDLSSNASAVFGKSVSSVDHLTAISEIVLGDLRGVTLNTRSLHTTEHMFLQTRE